jgi:hypothetical protein
MVREFAQVGPSLPITTGTKSDGHLIEQPGLEALPRDGARGDANVLLAATLLRERDRDSIPSVTNEKFSAPE